MTQSLSSSSSLSVVSSSHFSDTKHRRGIVNFRPYSDIICKSRKRSLLRLDSTRLPTTSPKRTSKQIDSLNESHLLPEILTHIFEFLDLSSKGRVAQVCQRWRDAVYRKSLWKSKCPKLHLMNSSCSSFHLFSSLSRRGIKSLQILSLSNSSLSELWAGMPDCEKLSLSGCINGSCEFSLQSLWQSPFVDSLQISLRALDLSLCKGVSEEDLECLFESLPCLEELSLAGCSQITNESLAHIPKTLIKLNLRSCSSFSHSGLIFLSTRNSLQLSELSLQDCQKISNESCQILARELRCLRALNLSFIVSISDLGLQYLSYLPALESLSLRSCENISDAGIAFLSVGPTSNSLGHLDLSFCAHISDESLRHIGSGCHSLHSLSLSTVSITDEGLCKLVTCLKESLRTLHIGQCSAISDRGLLSILNYSSKLSELDLYGCSKISTEALSLLSSKLLSLRKLMLELNV